MQKYLETELDTPDYPKVKEGVNKQEWAKYLSEDMQLEVWRAHLDTRAKHDRTEKRQETGVQEVVKKVH